MILKINIHHTFVIHEFVLKFGLQLFIIIKLYSAIDESISTVTDLWINNYQLINMTCHTVHVFMYKSPHYTCYSTDNSSIEISWLQPCSVYIWSTFVFYSTHDTKENSRSLTNSRNLDFYFNKLHFLLNGEICIPTLCLHVHTYTLRGNSNCKLLSPMICVLFINEHKLIIKK